MDLFLYDFEGNELGITDKVISSYRNLSFNDVGSSEFHIEPSDPIANVIAENDYLILEEDGRFQDIVIGYKDEDDFTIYCRSLSWLLSKMVVPPQTLSASLSSIVKTLLQSAYGCDISLGKVADISETVAFSESKAILFSDAIKGCLDAVNGGHSVRFSHEDNKFYLDILKGNNTDLYICQDEETLESLTSEKDLLDFSNSFSYLMRFPVISSWDPSLNSPTLTNNRPSNFGKCYRVDPTTEFTTRFDIEWNNGDYIYCNNKTGKWRRSLSPPDPIYAYIEDENVSDKYKWYHISNGSTKEEGLSSLAELTPKKSFSVTPKNIRFLKDYNLGDFSAVQYKSNGKIKTALCQFSDIVLSRDNLKNIENPTLKEVK